MSSPAALERLLPAPDVRTRHERLIAAPPDRVDAALRSVTLAEMPVARVLIALRGLQGRTDRPLIDGMVGAGFTVLADEPAHELAAGVCAQMWRRGGERAAIADAADFAAFRRPGFVKAATDMRMRAVDGGTLLVTETRVTATDPGALRAFRRYWLVVRPGSGLIRRAWLAAIARRAERAPAAAA